MIRSRADILASVILRPGGEEGQKRVLQNGCTPPASRLRVVTFLKQPCRIFFALFLLDVENSLRLCKGQKFLFVSSAPHRKLGQITCILPRTAYNGVIRWCEETPTFLVSTPRYGRILWKYRKEHINNGGQTTG